MAGDYQELLFRVRIVLADRFGIEQSEAEEIIDELRDAGIAFRDMENERGIHPARPPHTRNPEG